MVQWLAHWTLNPIIRVQFSVCPFLSTLLFLSLRASLLLQLSKSIISFSLTEFDQFYDIFNLPFMMQLRVSCLVAGCCASPQSSLKLCKTIHISTKEQKACLSPPCSLNYAIFQEGAFCHRTQQQFYYMERVLSQLQAKNPWKQAMRKCCRSNKLNVDLVSYFTPLRFRATYAKFQKIYQKRSEDPSDRWLENELKAFYWICVAVSCVTDVAISQFAEQQWKLLHQIFYCKTEVTLEYEAKKLIEDSTTRSAWQEAQETVLFGIVNSSTDHNNKWNEFARRLYQQSSKQYLRTGKQCRERWLNHLDPSKKHGEWTAQEDQKIVGLLLKTGKRWSKIAKELGKSRTEHMIKNRYKTIISRQKRLFPNIKSEEQLIKFYGESPRTMTSLPAQPNIQAQVGTEIKTQHKSQQLSRHVSSLQRQNEEGIDFNVSQLVVEQQNKIKLPPLGSAFDGPQVFSPWYVSIPITPTFSPTVPFFVNFSTTNFTPSFDSACANSFYFPPTNPRDSDNC